MHPDRKRYLIVGAGFSGAVLARELAERLNARVVVLDERSHPAGNCHTERDAGTGVMLHVYGPHIFNTDNLRVWEYVNRHGRFGAFVNRVKAITSRGVFSLPINLHTINQFFGASMGPSEAKAFLAARADRSIREPENFEQQALKHLGRELYDTFFYGYTKKQWGCEPGELPASVLKRLPVRFDYNDNYYDKRWQGIPEQGYTALVEHILDHPLIEVRLRESWVPGETRDVWDHLFYTGPLDAYFGYAEGRLGYRTVTFERIDTDLEDFQGNAQINYTDETCPWTRICEPKHFAPWEKLDRTVAFKEFSKETGPGDIPYYPKRLASDLALFARYRAMAFGCCNTSFLGRLATYRYLDMERVIGEALEFADRFVEATQAGRPVPIFSGPADLA